MTISKLIREACRTRLADDNLGLNANIAAALPDYDDIDMAVVTVEEWTPGGGSFLYGRVPPDAIERSSVLKYPLITVDTLRTGGQSMVMSAVFTGIVEAVIDVHLSWPDSDALMDFSSYGDIVEDSMFLTMNNPGALVVGSRYNCVGKLLLTRGPIVYGSGQNWRQTLTFQCPFIVTA
jgi:hypothetical protein